MWAHVLVSSIIQYGCSKDEKTLIQGCVALSDKQGLFCCITQELCITPHHHYSPCNNSDGTKGPDTLSGCIQLCVPVSVFVSLHARVSCSVWFRQQI